MINSYIINASPVLRELTGSVDLEIPVEHQELLLQYLSKPFYLLPEELWTMEILSLIDYLMLPEDKLIDHYIVYRKYHDLLKSFRFKLPTIDAPPFIQGSPTVEDILKYKIDMRRYNYCAVAAYCGRLEILKWAHSHGYLWDKKCCLYAGGTGHLHILQWAHAEGLPIYEDTFIIAARRGHLNILQWARSKDINLCQYTLAGAAAGKHLHILEWAHECGYPLDEYVCSAAAIGGSLEILKWLRAHDCPWNEWTCTNAAEKGHLHILKWARDNGCSWNEWTCAHAAQSGQFEVLQWLRAKDCPWEKHTISYAEQEGHMHIAQWAHENNCPSATRNASLNGVFENMPIRMMGADLFDQDIDPYVFKYHIQSNADKTRGVEGSEEANCSEEG